MLQAAPDTHLGDRHYGALILRLMLDRDGCLIQGELAGTTDTLHQWFTGSSGLKQAFDAGLGQQERIETQTEL